MITITQEEFNELLSSTSIKPRIKSELKFVSSTEKRATDWKDYELVAISDRNSNNGILLLQPDDKLYIIQYTLSKKIIDSQTGRSRATICDFCRTWQTGTNSASITLHNPDNKKSARYLCCADLLCSDHVRSITVAAKKSRAQLPEDLTNEDRIARLKKNLSERISQLDLRPIKST